MFSTIFGTIKQWGIAIVGVIILVLAGSTVYQKKRADRKEEEVDELEDQIAYSEHAHTVKDFEAINKERQGEADEKIKNIDDDTPSVKPNTTYSL